jgi:hypothetical protein
MIDVDIFVQNRDNHFLVCFYIRFFFLIRLRETGATSEAICIEDEQVGGDIPEVYCANGEGVGGL